MDKDTTNSRFGPTDKETIAVVNCILRMTDSHDAIELMLEYNRNEAGPFARFRVGKKWIPFPSVPEPLREPVFSRFLTLAGLATLELIRPGEFPSVGRASFELASRRRRGYARLFKERGRFLLHVHLLPGRAQDLFNAAAGNDVEAVQKMVRDGVDVNVHDFDGNTALMEAVANRHVPAAQALLGLGAEINARNNSGITALMMAYSQVDMIVLLLEHGADPNIRDYEGRTVLSMAMVKLQAKAASLLIERGAYVNVRGPGGRQPLIELAANTMPDEVVQMMLARGAEGSPVAHKQSPSNEALQPPPAEQGSDQ